MNIEKTISRLLKNNNGYIKISDALKLNISKFEFLSYVNKYQLSRVSQGLYMSSNSWKDNIYIIQARYPKIIFSHETAAYLLGLSDREPTNISLTMKVGTSSTRLNKEGLKVFKVKEDLFELGLIDASSPIGNEIRIYNRERTICDYIKYRKYIDSQELQTIIKSYIYSKDKDISKLMRYAKKLSVDKILRQYFEMLL